MREKAGEIMARKVLIVEDDNNIAELLHLYLEKEGFETQVAPDGGKGVELYRSFHPELVLLDIMLPVMDGWSVLKKIRETDKTPVILLTAKGETNDKVQGLEGGADDYIVKPFEMKEVLARIHAVLRRYGAENGERDVYKRQAPIHAKGCAAHWLDKKKRAPSSAEPPSWRRVSPSSRSSGPSTRFPWAISWGTRASAISTTPM